LYYFSLNQFAEDGDGGPSVDDWGFFAGGQLYTFVISGDDVDEYGIFAINIFPGVAYGATTINSPTWPLIDSPTVPCVTYNPPNEGIALYSTYSWTQSTTGYYDINVLFYNSSLQDDWTSTYIALFVGTFLNASNLGDPCNQAVTGAVFSNATDDDEPGVSLMYLYLSANTVYSLIFSGDDSDEFGYYAVQINPTRIRFLIDSPAYVQPTMVDDTTPITCTADTTTAASWDSIVFQAAQPVYIIATGDAPYGFTYFDSYSFLYAGLNPGNLLFAPASCPINAPLIDMEFTGDYFPLVINNTILNANYTVVVSTYDGDQTDDGAAYILYIFTGQPIGNIPSSTSSSTAGATTRSSTTGGGATGGLTTGKASSITTGSSNRTTVSTGTSTTSMAPRFGASLALSSFAVMTSILFLL
jgi:hypothetical protein